MTAPAKDITNQQFGQLLALRPTGRSTKNKAIVWECKCLACGQITHKSLVATDQELHGVS